MQAYFKTEELTVGYGDKPLIRDICISLEKGKYNPSLALAFKLARVFGMPIEEIFDDSDEQA